MYLQEHNDEHGDRQKRMPLFLVAGLVDPRDEFGHPRGCVEWACRFEHDADLLAAVYRAADVCVVSSLQDGMNLVAKEFVACRDDGDGVLVLSRFTGAADELGSALLVNPFFIDAFADTLGVALDMPADERRRRMAVLRHCVENATIRDWLEAVIAAAESSRHAAQGDAAAL